jgi:putative oxygen-independent coproporphyrinogen III oxidase
VLNITNLQKTKLRLPPMALYIHIPWCSRKCPYCDFNSHERVKKIPERNYVEALIADIKNDLHLVQGRKLSSLFFGGGTPSLFTGSSISKVIQSAEKMIGFNDDVEITLEANPESVTPRKLQDFYQAGINRISIGVQTFSDQQLNLLGRMHSSHSAIQAVEMAKTAGFKRINIDLMHGLEGQNVSSALNDLQCAISTEVEHISWYQLTIEKNTMFFSNPPKLPDSQLISEIQEHGAQLLQSHGYEQYEISAFAKPRKQCTHNQNYWQFGDYIGIGAGAHGKITLNNEQTIVRTLRTRQPNNYLETKNKGEKKCISVEISQRPLEFMMNVLRLKDGVPMKYFSERTGLHQSYISKIIINLKEQGLMVDSEKRLLTTPLGFRFLDTILDRFV